MACQVLKKRQFGRISPANRELVPLLAQSRGSTRRQEAHFFAKLRKTGSVFRKFAKDGSGPHSAKCTVRYKGGVGKEFFCDSVLLKCVMGKTHGAHEERCGMAI